MKTTLDVEKHKKSFEKQQTQWQSMKGAAVTEQTFEIFENSAYWNVGISEYLLNKYKKKSSNIF